LIDVEGDDAALLNINQVDEMEDVPTAAAISAADVQPLPTMDSGDPGSSAVLFQTAATPAQPAVSGADGVASGDAADAVEHQDNPDVPLPLEKLPLLFVSGAALQKLMMARCGRCGSPLVGDAHPLVSGWRSVSPVIQARVDEQQHLLCSVVVCGLADRICIDGG